MTYCLVFHDGKLHSKHSTLGNAFLSNQFTDLEKTLVYYYAPHATPQQSLARLSKGNTNWYNYKYYPIVVEDVPKEYRLMVLLLT